MNNEMLKGLKKKSMTRGMIAADSYRIKRSRVFYILIACALIAPILMTVMMSMMDGSVSVDPQTGVETVMRGPENAWQNIGTLPGGENMGSSDIFAMCNINMVFMGACVFVCIFICNDFRSGYSKNLFTVRVKKGNYVLSKILMGSICGALMLIFYLIGSVIGGLISGISFDLFGLSYVNIIMCMLAKICLVPMFVSLFVLASVIAKQKTWLAICLSLGSGMLLFMTVSLVTPLSSTALNVILCLVGGGAFALGFGAVSAVVLKKSALV